MRWRGLFFFLLMALPVSARVDMDRLTALYQQRDFATLAARLPRPAEGEEAALQFFRAVVDSQANRAVIALEKFVSNHPIHEYADDALFRMGQFHYTVGNYPQARRQFRNVVNVYPTSEWVDEAAYLVCQSYLVEENIDMAWVELQRFLGAYPRSEFIEYAILDLERLGGVSTSELEENQPEQTFYSIEIGQFEKQRSARSVARKLRPKFKHAFVEHRQVGDLSYYAVCIGRFETLEAANRFADRTVKSILDDYQIVSFTE